MDEHGKLERLSFFSDAVFAIAMTLLAIEVRLPHLHAPSEQALAQALVDLIPNYIGFVVSFVVIARFWIGHHRLMAMLRSADTRLVAANFGLLMTIAFMPFPTAVLSDYASLKVAVGGYAGYLMIVGLANILLIRTAVSGRRLVRDDAPVALIRRLQRAMWLPVGIGLVALAAAMVDAGLGLLALMAGPPLLGWIVSRGDAEPDLSAAAQPGEPSDDR